MSRSKATSSLSKDGVLNITTWCSDALHDLLGFTDSALASYLVHVAQQPKTTTLDLLQLLQQGSGQRDATSTAAASWKRFAHDLYHKCHPSRTAATAPKRKNNADWISEAKTYSLVPDEVVIEEPLQETSVREPLPSKQDKEGRESNKSKDKVDKNSKKDRSRDQKKHRRRQATSDDEDDDDEKSDGSRHEADKINLEQRQERRRQRSSRTNKQQSDDTDQPESSKSALTEEEQRELERERDLKERDEFVQRMLDRDKNKTKALIKEEEEKEATQKRFDLEMRLARGETIVDEKTGTAITLDRLREESRRAYLKKREERELALLKLELEDEKEDFADVKLTEAEKRRIALGQSILELVDQRDGGDDKAQEDGFYRLPDEYNDKQAKSKQDQNLLTSRYVEPKGEKSEQELWEESQTQKATSIGRKRKANEADDYELILDDQIDFVMQDTRPGYDKRDKKHREKSSSSRDVIVKNETLDDDAEESQRDIKTVLTAHQKILEGRKKLPVYPYREEFLAAVKDHQVLILVGETGSGKTTQIPQFLHEVGYSEMGKIGCTQPRRVAAMSVAARVAQEMNVRLGHEVGYSIRFENCTSPKTVIQYMTDGMLLREILTEPDMASYSCLIIDEAHERTLHTDILFGLVKDIVRFRSDLKLIISSATLDAEKFSKYFDDASIFMIPGRMFPVDIYYTKSPEADYVDAAIVTVLQIHVSQPLNGDILVFLTGQEEIETAAEVLIQRTRALGSKIKELIICPIYANLPSDQQAKIFEPTPKSARKVVLATNIAETSLTIDGICYVIDTGFSKQKSFNARSGMESLVVTPISQAASNQRAGRAGRTQPGKCFRLFTAWSFQHEMEPNTVPEIMRTNMGNVVLMLKSLGINDLLHFDFMDRPPTDALIRALEQLYALGALNDRGELTKMGRRMAEFPLDPMLSKCVIASEKYKCVSEVLSTVSMLSLGASVFFRPKEKAVHADTARLNFARGGGGDHIALLRCYSEWAATDFSTAWCFENFVQVRSMRKARDIREQLENLCERVELDHTTSSPDDIDAVLKSITSGYFYNVVRLGRSGEYQTVKQSKTVYIHPSSVLAKEESPPPWLVYFELALTSKEFMRQVAPIQPSWLVEIAPHFYQESDVEDAKSKKVPRSWKR